MRNLILMASLSLCACSGQAPGDEATPEQGTAEPGSVGAGATGSSVVHSAAPTNAAPVSARANDTVSEATLRITPTVGHFEGLGSQAPLRADAPVASLGDSAFVAAGESTVEESAHAEYSAARFMELEAVRAVEEAAR